MEISLKALLKLPVFKKSALHQKEPKMKGSGTTGLVNMGNTCFMNSILQCLSHAVELRDYSIASGFNRQLNWKSPLQGKLIRAFAELMKLLWSDVTSDVIPTTLKLQIQKLSNKFVGNCQHDSQEFLRFLLDGLHQEINQVQTPSPSPLQNLTSLSPADRAKASWTWYEMRDKSFIFDLFVGQLQSSLECLECGHVSLTFDPFWDLSLPIQKFSTDSSDIPIRLHECLELFTKEEVLERDEMPVCSECNVKQKMKKKLLIHRFPQILVIHLKRFREGNQYKQKQTRGVSFPVRSLLDLSSFSTDICDHKQSASYQLFAVSNHSGACNAGHYTAFCKNQEMNQWHEFDDSRVSKISEGRVCTKQAYVLFYERKQIENN